MRASESRLKTMNVLYLLSARGQGSMDPEVNITETDPPSVGYRVYGQIATDVLLNCYVENLPEDLQVRREPAGGPPGTSRTCRRTSRYVENLMEDLQVRREPAGEPPGTSRACRRTSRYVENLPGDQALA